MDCRRRLWSVAELEALGRQLDLPAEKARRKVAGANGTWFWTPTARDLFLERMLRIRSKTRRTFFLLNRAQREYSKRCTKQNIVLKARQLGITTYIAARFFIQTITQRGTSSMQVAHDRESAEEIFQIIRRFWEKLPVNLRRGPLQTSRCNARQLVFPKMDSEFAVAAAEENAGRGRTIQNLHCSEVSRWGRSGEEALASLRAAVVPGGEIVLESTANGAGGLFYEEWQRADETGYTRHFFPWWFDDGYVNEVGRNFAALTEEEAAEQAAAAAAKAAAAPQPAAEAPQAAGGATPAPEWVEDVARAEAAAAPAVEAAPAAQPAVEEAAAAPEAPTAGEALQKLVKTDDSAQKRSGTETVDINLPPIGELPAMELTATEAASDSGDAEDTVQVYEISEEDANAPAEELAEAQPAKVSDD